MLLGEADMKRELVIICLVMVFAGFGCIGTGKSGADKRIMVTSENYDQICNMQWLLKEMHSGGQKFLPAQDAPFMEFKPDGKIAGFASVNRFFGSLSIDDQGRVAIPPMGSTMMAGPEELMAREMAFLSVFQKISHFYRDGIFLYALTEDPDEELTFFVPVQ